MEKVDKQKEAVPIRIFRFYYDGFRAMTLGKTLWMLILVKVFIMFVILKIFFFPHYMNRFDTTAEKEDYISNELVERALNP